MLSFQDAFYSSRDETYLPSWRCGSGASRLSRCRAARSLRAEGGGGESLQNQTFLLSSLSAVFFTSTCLRGSKSMNEPPPDPSVLVPDPSDQGTSFLGTSPTRLRLLLPSVS